MFCKNFVGKVQSKMGHAQKEPRKQICQQQTGYPRTLKTYIMASYLLLLAFIFCKNCSWLSVSHGWNISTLMLHRTEMKYWWPAHYFLFLLYYVFLFVHFAFGFVYFFTFHICLSENEGFSRKKKLDRKCFDVRGAKQSN